MLRRDPRVNVCCQGMLLKKSVPSYSARFSWVFTPNRLRSNKVYKQRTSNSKDEQADRDANHFKSYE